MLPYYNNAYAKAKLIGALLKLEKFSVFTDLTLNLDNKNYTPDISLYPKRDVNLSLPEPIEMIEKFGDKIEHVHWKDLPEEFKKSTIITLSKKVYIHLSTMGIRCVLANRVKGYHDVFLRTAYLQGRAYDYIQEAFGKK